jgi:hypothetical protein
LLIASDTASFVLEHFERQFLFVVLRFGNDREIVSGSIRRLVPRSAGKGS